MGTGRRDEDKRELLGTERKWWVQWGRDCKTGVGLGVGGGGEKEGDSVGKEEEIEEAELGDWTGWDWRSEGSNQGQERRGEPE